MSFISKFYYSKYLTKNSYPKFLFVRNYAEKNPNKLKPQQADFNPRSRRPPQPPKPKMDPVKIINLIGTFTIVSIVLISYLVVKKTQKMKSDEIIMREFLGKNIVLDPNVALQNQNSGEDNNFDLENLGKEETSYNIPFTQSATEMVQLKRP
ncbi:unnamed protein product [Ceutorhynchus assimilis]|uniref:Uncharacterized protein n=1 Tax=Ceutorhynchus assimilis TaxID=467358 RepID=A0A9N9MJ52_9CUCU|nr:unnamed protein product [Ceutorhynchus assimilis]